jgi:AbiV family abortive infection protein
MDKLGTLTSKPTSNRDVKRLGIVEEFGGSFLNMLKNAIKLLHDAQLLRRHRRYASATALAILSIEESGKFLAHETEVLNIGRSPITQKKNHALRHKTKQKLSAHAIISMMPLSDITKILELSGYKTEIVPIGTKKRVSLAEALEDSAKSLRKNIDEINTKNRKHLHFTLSLLRGEFDDLKKQCLYVDVTDDGQTITPIIDRPTADIAIKLANAAIFSITDVLRRRNKARSYKSSRASGDVTA